MIRSTLFLATVTAGMMLSLQAQAVTVNRTNLSHGTANCQSALPVFDRNIRKRPKAFANVGSSTAFVTCDFETINIFGEGAYDVRVYLINRSGASRTVNCTFVDGFGEGVSSPSLVKSVAMPTDTTPATLGVTADLDNGNLNFVAPSISCALPPGVEIYAVGRWFREEVGG